MEKLTKNADRDRRVRQQLRTLGWRALTVWECQLKQIDRAAERIRTFLEE